MRVAFVPTWASTTASQADYAMCVGLQCAARSPNARGETATAPGGERGGRYAALDRAHSSGVHHCRTKNSASHLRLFSLHRSRCTVNRCRDSASQCELVRTFTVMIDDETLHDNGGPDSGHRALLMHPIEPRARAVHLHAIAS